MGLSWASRSLTCSARADSLTPQKRNRRLAKTPSATPACRNQGSAVASHIALSSDGTPGKVSTVKPATGLQIIPGAVPVGLGSTSAPRGSHA